MRIYEALHHMHHMLHMLPSMSMWTCASMRPCTTCITCCIQHNYDHLCPSAMTIYEALDHMHHMHHMHHMLPSTQLHKHNSTGGCFAPWGGEGGLHPTQPHFGDRRGLGIRVRAGDRVCLLSCNGILLHGCFSECLRHECADGCEHRMEHELAFVRPDSSYHQDLRHVGMPAAL